MTFAITDEKFCEDYFSKMLTKDIWRLFNKGYHNFDTEDEFNRVWKILQSHLENFTLPKPIEISVRIKAV